MFKLDDRLAADTVAVGSMPLSELLLMNNSSYPWFILVPRCDVIEIHELPLEQQQQLLLEYNAVASMLQSRFTIDKLNTGALGNIVRQLHIHVVGRCHSDACWPGPVWGQAQGAEYTASRLAEIRQWVQLDVVQAL